MSKLLNIAGFYSGIYIKSAVKGDVYYIQAKHFDSGGEFITSVKAELQLDDKIEKHLLRPGDVLLAVKGYNNFAVHYKGIIKQAVASSTFIVIRLNDQKMVLPEFLCWFLNRPQSQQFFKDNSRGSDLPSLTINAVKGLEVFIPAMQKQKTILELHGLRKREKELKQKIETLRESQIQQQILNAIR